MYEFLLINNLDVGIEIINYDHPPSLKESIDMKFNRNGPTGFSIVWIRIIFINNNIVAKCQNSKSKSLYPIKYIIIICWYIIILCRYLTDMRPFMIIPQNRWNQNGHSPKTYIGSYGGPVMGAKVQSMLKKISWTAIKLITNKPSKKWFI